MGSEPRHEQPPKKRNRNGRNGSGPVRSAPAESTRAEAGSGSRSELGDIPEVPAGANGAGDGPGAPAFDPTIGHEGERNGSGRPSGPPVPPFKAPVPPSGGTPEPKPRLRKLRAALVLLGLAMLAFVSWIFGIMMAVAHDLPALENRAQFARAQNPIVYDVRGEEIATLTNNEGRILLPSEEIAATAKEAVVAVEDARFYSHRGIDYRGIARAVYQDILARSAQEGGSTVTQQFVKNALQAQDSRTIFQKLREAALAYHLERNWSKDKILTEYLNSIYFGEGAYGIESAARTYFGSQPEHEGCGEGDGAPTCASELRPHEAALLAGMIASPTMYSPRANPDAALARRNLVLQRMSEQGYIAPEEYEDYAAEPLPEEDDITAPRESSEAPYFTSWLRQQLVDMYGAGQAFGGGLEVHSTLDLELQQEVETIVAQRLGAIEPTAAVVVLDNDTSGVLAMVGGDDYDSQPFNLATQGARQPGSAFKIFTLVAALESGHSPNDVYNSTSLELPYQARVPRENGNGTEVVDDVFAVTNYNDSYLGSASIASATTHSDNSIFTQLGMELGPAEVAETAAEMGVESSLRAEQRYSVNGEGFKPYNPALILGGLTTGVSPLEMAHAYETIAQEGNRVSGTMAAADGSVVGINKVTKRQGDAPTPGGNPVETNDGESGENRVETESVIDPEVAEQTRSLLTGVVTSGTGTNAAPSSGVEVWGKTGTTDDNGDAWFCGASDEITACVWVGHADGRVPMRTEYGGAPVDGGTYPALIFADIIDAWESLLTARGERDEEEEPAPVAPVAPAPEPAPAPVPEAPVEAAPPAPATEESAGAPGGSGGGGDAVSGGGAQP